MSDWEQYVEPAAEAMWESFRPGFWSRGDGVLEPIPAWADCAEEERESCRGEFRAALAVVGPMIAEDTRERLVAAAAAVVERDEIQHPAVALVQDFVDADACWYDHHGYCQAHGWFDTNPACPHARARTLLAELGIEVDFT